MNSNVILLDKTRKIGKLLHNNSTGKVVFSDICSVMADILKSNIYIISRKGKVLGVGKCPDVSPLNELITGKVGTFIDDSLNERLLSVLSTKENVNLATLGFEQSADAESNAIVSPIEIAGERLGTVFLYRHSDA